jgi:hypothetical protein
MQEEQLGLLQDYITHQKLQHTMARNLLLADALSSDLAEAPSGMGSVLTVGCFFFFFFFFFISLSDKTSC